MFGAALLLMCARSAHAEEPSGPVPDATLPSVPAVAPVDEAQVPGALPAPRVLAFAERFVWEQRGSFRRAGAITSVAVQPTASPGWLAVDEGGWVWRSEDRGATWSLVAFGQLGAEGPGARQADDEDILLDAELTQDEELRDAGEDAGEDASGAAALAREAAEAASERAADSDGTAAAAPSPPVVWFHPLDPRIALVGRDDGIWRSEDAGLTFHKTASEGGALTFFADDLSGLLIAGTTEGVRWSGDGGSTWIDSDDAIDDARVGQVARKGGVYYAATDAGLFRSRDALRWERVDGLDVADIVGVVPDPDWEGGIWIATRSGLLRTDDDGKTFYTSGRQPLTDVRALVPAGGPGHLLAATGDGIWETMDGGVRWVPAGRLLSDPDVRAITFDTGIPVIATSGAIWRMVAPAAIGELRGTRVEVLPLAEVVRLTQTRAGLDMDMLSLANRGLAAALAPQLEVTFDFGRSASRSADFRQLENEESRDQDWSIQAKLCWGACGVLIVSDSGEIVSDDVPEALTEEGETVDLEELLYVVDGEVFDEGQTVAAAANVGQRIRAYRISIADQVSDAWISRRRMSAEAATVQSLPLRDQVLHALKIAELDARLDAYTDGAFTRATVKTEEIR